MICSSFIELDATISFKTIRDFFGATAPSGKCDVIKTESEFVYKYMGDENVLQYVWAKLLGIGMSSHVMSHLCVKSLHDESSSKNSNNALNSRHNTPRLETRGSSSSHLNRCAIHMRISIDFVFLNSLLYLYILNCLIIPCSVLHIPYISIPSFLLSVITSFPHSVLSTVFT